MKKFFTPILFYLSAIVNAQVPSSCSVPPELRDGYNKDIMQLATNYLDQIQSPDTIFVHPPQNVIDEISGGLAAILNANTPESDTVFNLYCVRNLNGWPGDYAGFLVQVDTSVAWTHAWQNLITITGNSYVDSLTSQYALHIDNFYNWSFGNYAELGVDSAWNIMALMDSLRYAPGVIFVEPNFFVGQAGTITYEKTGSDRYFSFYFEFSDCFDGCDNYRRWDFKVDSACSIYYLGFTDWGFFGISPLPAPLNCNLFDLVHTIPINNLKVYPNPAEDELRITLESHSINKITVYNLLGETILENIPAQATSNEVVLNISNFKPGVYFVNATGNEKTFRSTFVKSKR